MSSSARARFRASRALQRQNGTGTFSAPRRGTGGLGQCLDPVGNRGDRLTEQNISEALSRFGQDIQVLGPMPLVR